MGLAPDDPRQAHHIIPWALANDASQDVIQKAAQARFPFHVQDVLNGIPLSAIQHNGPHSEYTKRVGKALKEISETYGATLTPEIAFQELVNLTNRIKNTILANPITPINNLIF